MPGPAEFGRGVIVLPHNDVPPSWASCREIVVGKAEMNSPTPVVDVLHHAWTERRPVVVRLGADLDDLRSPEQCARPVYELTPDFEFTRERLQFLVWANNFDARSGEPVWWHGRKAARLFAADGVTEGGAADITLADGTPLYIDGGPLGPPSLPSGVGVVHRWNSEAGRLRPGDVRLSSTALAPDQLAAVRHLTGPAGVIAPAGSANTRVLIERIRHLVVDRGMHPNTVTALAFNAKAAEQ